MNRFFFIAAISLLAFGSGSGIAAESSGLSPAMRALFDKTARHRSIVGRWDFVERFSPGPPIEPEFCATESFEDYERDGGFHSNLADGYYRFDGRTLRVTITKAFSETGSTKVMKPPRSYRHRIRFVTPHAILVTTADGQQVRMVRCVDE